MDQLSFDPRVTLDKCVHVYGLIWAGYAHTLRAARRHALARQVAALTVTTIDDTGAADALLRARNVYDRRHPRRTSPVGFLPLLGLRLALVHMQDCLNPIAGIGPQFGTFDGHLYEFHQATTQFLAEVDGTAGDTLADDITAVYFDIPPLPTLTPKRLRQLTRRYKIRRLGDGYGIVTPTYTVRTWKFGRGYQSVVDVDGVRIDLRAYADSASALERGLEWAAALQRLGPPSPDSVITDCFKHWPTLHRTRLDVLNRLFFTIGNGYAWVRGGVISTSPDDYLARDDRPRRQPDPPPGPVHDDGGPYDFYPVSPDHSNIFKVPDDVTDAWLAVAYEAAVALRDRSRNAASRYGVHGAFNRKHGEAIVTQLCARFPTRLPR